MKPFKRIIAIAGVVFTIVMFWLVPGIDAAKDTLYTRIYEDTDNGRTIGDSLLKSNPKYPADTTVKKYKRESISSKAKLKSIKPAMFSRSIHFQELLELDSASEKQLTISDSTKSIPMAVSEPNIHEEISKINSTFDKIIDERIE